MNDLDLVRQIRADLPPPTGQRLASGRARLLTSITQDTAAPARLGPRRRVLAAAAAGILVVGGAAYGLSAGLSHPGAPAGSPGTLAAGLTAVNGCPGLDAASGRLVKVTGSSLVLISAGHGRPVKVTVTTRGSTQVNRQVAGSGRDVTDGERVYVRGTETHGRIAAQFVNLNVDLNKLPGKPGRPYRRPSFGGLALGTVADAGTGHFTVVTAPGGARVPVTLSASTTIHTLVRTQLSQLRTGAFTAAAGSAGPGGTLVAATIDQGTYLPHLGARPGGTGLGCSSAAVATAFLNPR